MIIFTVVDVNCVRVCMSAHIGDHLHSCRVYEYTTCNKSKITCVECSLKTNLQGALAIRGIISTYVFPVDQGRRLYIQCIHIRM